MDAEASGDDCADRSSAEEDGGLCQILSSA